MGTALVVLHIDGLGADSLEEALRAGLMPFTQHLIDGEGYEIHRYRCGLPSTTPFVQAGILYGDNTNIPSFRWWDRERQLMVQFGAGSTFKKVGRQVFPRLPPIRPARRLHRRLLPGRRRRGLWHQLPGKDVFGR